MSTGIVLGGAPVSRRVEISRQCDLRLVCCRTQHLFCLALGNALFRGMRGCSVVGSHWMGALL